MSASENTRPEKGKSLLCATRDFVAVDLETTGLSTEYDDIIEIGAVRYRDGTPVATYAQLVNPGHDVDDFITELTGITNEMLEGQPSIGDVLPGFMDFLADDIVIGHNVNFDINFLYDNCQNCGLKAVSNDFIDTLRVSRRMLPDLENHKMDTVAEALQLSGRDLHRATGDAVIAANIYLELLHRPEFETAMESHRSSRYYSQVKASEITAVPGEADFDNPLFGMYVVFTGTLEKMTRKEAMQIVANIGGIPADTVTKKTNFLVLGNNDYCKAIKDGKSTKQKKAEKLILEGADLQIMPEAVFYDLISE